MNFIFDIETIPCQDAILMEVLRNDMKAELDEGLANIRAPSNYKDESKIADYVNNAHTTMLAGHEAKVQDAFLKTSFDGGMGQICVVGFAVNDEPPISHQVENLSTTAERMLLEQFFESINQARKDGDPMCFIGHNLIAFDIRFVWQRAMVLNVKPPFNFPRDPKPWGDSTFDTILAWSGLSRGGSMDKLCRIFNIPGKGEMDGSKVWPMVQTGQIDAVASYCRDDVERTRALHRRMTFA